MADEPTFCRDWRTKPPRPARIEGDIAYIELSQGQTVKVDVADLPLIKDIRWYAVRGRWSFYAVCHEYLENGSRRMMQMHRLLMSAPRGLVVDHIDCNGLNNTRANLRLATPRQNACNRRINRTSTSGFKGVTWHAKAKKWRACIRSGKKLISLGLHETKEAAHAEYAKALKIYHGEFARAS